ncbi:MAG: 2-oxoglutarate and iron-dependent oxygenase domain-containing protein [Woeseiaceae bacterium]|nr:2-oxoglutarate and iron-dependent oxygenase domain-containing protein [Woeseiaceae bacterium]
MSAHPGDIDLDKAPRAPRGIEGVPVIDIAEIRSGVRDPGAAAIREIAAACRTWGFFQVVGHGVDGRLIESVWEQTRRFFAQPMAQKEALLRSRENPWGYYNNELTKNQRDKKEVFDLTTDGVDPVYGAENRWPESLHGFRDTLGDYRDACTQLSLDLLEAMCAGLGLEPGHLNEHFDPLHTGFLRLNFYPVRDPLAGRGDIAHLEVADLGVHHHTDAGALTVLMQDATGGLQVYNDGYWYDVPPLPGAFVINTGDMMQVWSNDRYRAAMHRVLAMDTIDRYSLPFFFNPNAGTLVEPLPGVVSADEPARYDPIDWGEFRYRRTDGDYADYGTEVQISQYRRSTAESIEE